MTRRRDLFPPDRALQARMGLAIAVQVALLGALLAGTVWIATFDPESWKLLGFLLIVPALGFLQAYVVARKERDRGAREPTGEDERRVRGAVERLAVQGGIAAPAVAVERVQAPLSWTTAVPWGRRTIHVTTGLLDGLDDPRLEAVVAHELGHIANRDATVMTVLAGPGTSMLRGLRALWEDKSEDVVRRLCAVVVFGVVFAPIGAVLTLSARIVSRHRELAADRAAAVLTGSPAGVAAALLAVGEGLERIPRKDLRSVAARDPFHFVPAREASGVRRLWATHPRVATRIERLERMESRLQDKTR